MLQKSDDIFTQLHKNELVLIFFGTQKVTDNIIL